MNQIPFNEFEQFHDWEKLKIRLHVRNRKEVYFDIREIWWASIGYNVGSEINGKNATFERPVLILKKVSGTTFWALPITSKVKEGVWSQYHFINQDGEANAIAWTQIRLMSAGRLLRRVGKLSVEDYNGINRKVVEFLKI